MIGWSGRRKALTILLFIAPTILGVLLFSVYPILYNGYISLTNNNKFHPQPDCSMTAAKVFEPVCWGIFPKPRAGITTPFRVQDPFWANYADLAGKLFTGPALLALVRILLCLVPLFVAGRVNQRLDRQLTRPVSSIVVWLAAVVGTLLLALLVDFRGAWDIFMKSGDFFVVMLRTLMYVAFCIPLFFVVALFLALILNMPNLRGRTFFRVVMVVPWAASTVAIMMSLIWQFFFRQQGTINQLLHAAFGIQGPTWLTNQTLAFAVIVLVNVWYSYPFFMVVILGALQSIPLEQYEAAEMDGASYWQQLLSITLPLLRPAVLPAIVLSSITTFQMFDTVWAITQGGPSAGAGAPGGTELVMVFGYKQVFQSSAYGRMGAMAVIVFILLFLATLYSMRVTQITKGAYE
jgi:arabinogalactan oligomer/maltooligosaccharide transport system permease protein